MIIIDPNRTTWWTLPVDKGENGPPARFEIRTPRVEDEERFLVERNAGRGVQALILMTTRCVVGWENVHDDKGTPLPFNLENFTRLSATIRMMIGDHIIGELLSVGVGEAKN